MGGRGNRRGLAGLVAGACLLLVAASCESPTLPLPPPAEPTMLAGSDADHVTLVASDCGDAEANALIVIENQNPTLTGDMVGSITRADTCGRWQVQVYAHNGDDLEIWQEFGGESSTPEDVTVTVP